MRNYLKGFKSAIPIFLILATLIVNLINLFPAIRSHPALLGLGIFKPILKVLSVIPILPINLIYLFLVVYMTKTVRINIISKLTLVTFYINLFLITLLFLYFSHLETTHFPDFVLNTYHIYLSFLRSYSVFLFIVIMVSIEANSYFTSRQGLLAHVPHMLVSLVLFTNIFVLPNIFIKESKLIVKALSSSQTDAKLMEFGGLYDNLMFIVNNTEPSSTIIHPNQSTTFPLIGNQPIIRYILFPRTLVSDELVDKYSNANPNPRSPIYYILTIGYKDDLPVFFPTGNINAKEIKIYVSKNSTLNFSEVVYNEQFVKSLGIFQIGLIKI